MNQRILTVFDLSYISFSVVHRIRNGIAIARRVERILRGREGVVDELRVSCREARVNAERRGGGSIAAGKVVAAEVDHLDITFSQVRIGTAGRSRLLNQLEPGHWVGQDGLEVVISDKSALQVLHVNAKGFGHLHIVVLDLQPLSAPDKDRFLRKHSKTVPQDLDHSLVVVVAIGVVGLGRVILPLGVDHVQNKGGIIGTKAIGGIVEARKGAVLNPDDWRSSVVAVGRLDDESISLDPVQQELDPLFDQELVVVVGEPGELDVPEVDATKPLFGVDSVFSLGSLKAKQVQLVNVLGDEGSSIHPPGQVIGAAVSESGLDNLAIPDPEQGSLFPLVTKSFYAVQVAIGL